MLGSIGHVRGDMMFVRIGSMSENAGYWIVIDGKSWLPGKRPRLTRRIGPFVSLDEAEAALPDHLPWDTDTYVYHVRIEPDGPNCNPAAPQA